MAPAHDERSPIPKMNLNSNAGNHALENKDSSNGGLVFEDNVQVLNMTKDDVVKHCNLPNKDLTIDDIELIPTKPKMPC